MTSNILVVTAILSYPFMHLIKEEKTQYFEK